MNFFKNLIFKWKMKKHLKNRLKRGNGFAAYNDLLRINSIIMGRQDFLKKIYYENQKLRTSLHRNIFG